MGGGGIALYEARRVSSRGAPDLKHFEAADAYNYSNSPEQAGNNCLGKRNAAAEIIPRTAQAGKETQSQRALDSQTLEHARWSVSDGLVNAGGRCAGACMRCRGSL